MRRPRGERRGLASGHCLAPDAGFLRLRDLVGVEVMTFAVVFILVLVFVVVAFSAFWGD